jgi:hypothetical protein
VNLQNRPETSSPDIGTNHIWQGFVDTDQGIPSLKRELATVDKTRLAILSFLQTPVLLHTHQEYFADSDFTDVAARVNEMNPGIEWNGLGAVCNHLFLKRLDDDGTYRVLLFGSKSVLRNDDPQERLFRFERFVPRNIPVRQVTLDQQPISFSQQADRVFFQAPIIPGGQVVIDVQYADVSNAGSADIERRDLRVWILRYASDIRDMVLSKSVIGRRLIEIYYTRMGASYGMIDWVLALALSALTAASVWILWRLIKPSTGADEPTSARAAGK